MNVFENSSLLAALKEVLPGNLDTMAAAGEKWRMLRLAAIAQENGPEQVYKFIMMLGTEAEVDNMIMGSRLAAAHGIKYPDGTETSLSMALLALCAELPAAGQKFDAPERQAWLVKIVELLQRAYGPDSEDRMIGVMWGVPVRRPAGDPERN